MSEQNVLTAIAALQGIVIELRETVTQLQHRVDERFERVDAEFGRIDDRFVRVDREFAGVNQRLDILTGEVRRIDTKIDHLRDTTAGHFEALEAKLDERYRRWLS